MMLDGRTTTAPALTRLAAPRQRALSGSKPSAVATSQRMRLSGRLRQAPSVFAVDASWSCEWPFQDRGLQEKKIGGSTAANSHVGSVGSELSRKGPHPGHRNLLNAGKAREKAPGA